MKTLLVQRNESSNILILELINMIRFRFRLRIPMREPKWDSYQEKKKKLEIYVT